MTGPKVSGISATILGGPRIESFEEERGEQVTAMTLSTMIGMHGDLVDEGA